MIFRGIAFGLPRVGAVLDGEQAVCALAPLRCAQNVAHHAHGLLTVLRSNKVRLAHKIASAKPKANSLRVR